jgi:hypothetical protein
LIGKTTHSRHRQPARFWVDPHDEQSRGVHCFGQFFERWFASSPNRGTPDLSLAQWRLARYVRRDAFQRLTSMGLGEKIRKQVGRPRQANALRELQTLNENLRSLGIKLPTPDARHVRKSVGKAQPRER